MITDVDQQRQAMQTKEWISVILMVTLAPVSAVTTLVCWNPGCWGGTVNPLAILAMSAFALFTVPLWPTYIPAIILTPFLMRRVSRTATFAKMPVILLLTISTFIGATAGICILGYVVLTSLRDSTELALNWSAAGAVSGALTFSVICAVYRRYNTVQNGRHPAAGD